MQAKEIIVEKLIPFEIKMVKNNADLYPQECLNRNVSNCNCRGEFLQQKLILKNRMAMKNGFHLVNFLYQLMNR